jgi:hypothetical protein
MGGLENDSERSRREEKGVPRASSMGVVVGQQASLVSFLC